jgi:hypothetical protein
MSASSTTLPFDSAFVDRENYMRLSTPVLAFTADVLRKHFRLTWQRVSGRDWTNDRTAIAAFW